MLNITITITFMTVLVHELNLLLLKINKTEYTNIHTCGKLVQVSVKCCYY